MGMGMGIGAGVGIGMGVGASIRLCWPLLGGAALLAATRPWHLLFMLAGLAV